MSYKKLFFSVTLFLLTSFLTFSVTFCVWNTQFKVNTYTSSSQDCPSVAMDSDGNVVIAWCSYDQDGSKYGIYAQRYDKYGDPVGSEFQVNTYTTNSQSFPSVAMDSDGDFVITWKSDGQDGSGYGIYAQRYDKNGTPIGSEFQVNTYTTNNQENPSVAMDYDGDFVITWDGYGINAQRYDKNAVPLGSEFKVNTYSSMQRDPSIAMDSDGDFVITWESYGQDGSKYGIYAQRYDKNGVPLGSEFKVNTYTTSEQENPSVAMDSDGDFVITWDGVGSGCDDYDIYAQRYDKNGVPLGSEFMVNTYITSGQWVPSAAMDSDGDFVITWASYGQDYSYGYGIYAQRYDKNGVPLDSEFQVNGSSSKDQDYSTVAMLSEGIIVITWQSWYQDGSQCGIYAKYYYELNTQEGTDVEVNFPETETILTFETVTSSGNTTVEMTTDGPPLPTGFELNPLDTYYDINTTAEYDDSIEICIEYDDTGLTQVQEEGLMLKHYNEDMDTWEDITTSLDTENNIICGETNSFSYFAVMYQSEEENAITLESFSAHTENNNIILTWSTGTEIDNLGFYIVKSESIDNGFILLNEEIILAKGDAHSGYDYSYIDTHVNPGHVYYYWLADLDVHGEYTIHGPVKVVTNILK